MIFLTQKNWFKLGAELAIIIALTQCLAAQETANSLKVLPGPNDNLWEWLSKTEMNGFSPGETLEYYFENRARFEETPLGLSPDTAATRFFLAECALRSASHEFENLLETAKQRAEIALEKNQSLSKSYSFLVPGSATKLALQIAYSGRYREAWELMNWVARIADAKDSFVISTQLHIAEMQGDYDLAESLSERHAAVSADLIAKYSSFRIPDSIRRARIRALRGSVPGDVLMSEVAQVENDLKSHLASEIAESGSRPEDIPSLGKVFLAHNMAKKVYSDLAFTSSVIGDIASAARFVDLAEDHSTQEEQLKKAIRESKNTDTGDSFVRAEHYRIMAGAGGAGSDLDNMRTLGEAAKAGSVHLQIGNFRKAEAAFEKAIDAAKGFPETHHERRRAMSGLAWSKLLSGDSSAATEIAKECNRIESAGIAETIQYGTGRQRLAYIQNSDPYSLLIETNQVEELANAVFRTRGVVLESIMVESRIDALADGEDRARAVRLRNLRGAVGEMLLSDPDRATALQSEINEILADLGETHPALVSLNSIREVSLSNVQSRIGNSEVVIEFIRYRTLETTGRFTQRYGALVLQRDVAPKWKALGPAAEVDDLVGRFNAMMQESPGGTSETDLLDLSSRLYNLLLLPLEEEIGNAAHLRIVPESSLGLLSFGVLADRESRFALEKWDISYLVSSRDLLKEKTTTTSPGAMVLMGEPDFDREPSGDLSGVPDQEISRFVDVGALPQLTPLPGTGVEVLEIARIAEANGFKVTLGTGGDSSETALRGLSEPPSILHLATHGFVLPKKHKRESHLVVGEYSPDPNAAVSLTPIFDDPLLRASLAFAGANPTFQSWEKGTFPSPHDDGILSGREISSLNLSGTRLVVLSACDTALGDASVGDGVLGLRRAFRIAGAQNLLVTFWPIADEFSAELIAEFYKELFRSDAPGKSLAKVQRENFQALRESHGLLHAIALTGPFGAILTGDSE